MTLSEMSEKAVDLTEAELKQFYKTIAKEYRDAEKAIKVELEELYLKVLSGVKPEDYYNTVLKVRRMEKLILKIQDEYIKASIKAGDLSYEAARVAITNNFYRQRYSLAFASDHINPINLSFVALDPNVIEVSVVGTREVWKKITEKKLDEIRERFGDLKNYQPKHGTLQESLLDNRKEILLKIRQNITQGLAKGDSFVQMSKRIQGVMLNAYHQAERIVRTEGHRNMMAGQYANVLNARNEYGIDVRRQIISTLDDRTRPQSAQIDTKLENDNGVFIYPDGVEVSFPGNSGVAKWDINDREVVVQRLDGFSINERKGRNPVTGKSETMSFKSFETWAKQNGLKRNRYGQLLF